MAQLRWKKNQYKHHIYRYTEIPKMWNEFFEKIVQIEALTLSGTGRVTILATTPGRKII